MKEDINLGEKFVEKLEYDRKRYIIECNIQKSKDNKGKLNLSKQIQLNKLKNKLQDKDLQPQQQLQQNIVRHTPFSKQKKSRFEKLSNFESETTTEINNQNHTIQNTNINISSLTSNTQNGRLNGDRLESQHTSNMASISSEKRNTHTPDNNSNYTIYNMKNVNRKSQKYNNLNSLSNSSSHWS